MREIVKYSGCFVCGDQNPIGLNVHFYADGEEAVAECLADPQFQGYKDIFHGGVVSALLDEIMAKAILAQEIYPLTAEMTVRFKKAVPTGQRLFLRGRITSRRGRMFEASGELTGIDGAVFATATGKYIAASGTMRGLLLGSLETDAKSACHES
jgi:acyl-coenzyme A thioesterase PaaI-like protein